MALHPLASVRHYLDAVVLPAVAAGAKKRDVRLAAWMISSVDEDGELARDRVKSNLAFYFSTPSYRTVVEGTSWEPVAVAVRDRFREIGPRWSDIAPLIPDEMVEAFSLAGRPEEIAARLPTLEQELAERGVDEMVFQTVGIGLDDAATVDNIRRIIEMAGVAALD